MNSKAVGVIIGAIVFIMLCRGCLQQERCATVRAIAENMPNCDRSSVIVSEDGESFSYSTKSGKVKSYGVEWKSGRPSVWQCY